MPGLCISFWVKDGLEDSCGTAQADSERVCALAFERYEAIVF